MLFEITSSALVAGVVGYTYFLQSGGKSDHTKIQRICSNCGLNVKENGKVKNIHLQRKTKKEWGSEYIFRIPLGLSFKDFENKLPQIQDGLNNKKSFINVNLKDFKGIKFDKNLFKTIEKIITNKEKIQKEVELSYDGMLHVKVYNDKLTEFLPYSPGLNLKGWRIPIGQSRSSYITHDFDKIPHMVVAGTTRYGKSVFIKNATTTLIKNKPDDVKFSLLDLKGGLTLGRYEDCAQVDGLATNTEESVAILERIEKEMDDMMRRMRRDNLENIVNSKIKTRHFIIVDEAADISPGVEKEPEAKKLKYTCDRILTKISRIGGALGYRLIYATQSPYSEVLNHNIKQNCDAKLCFRLQTERASTVVIDEGGAEKLPLVRGRGIYMTDRKQIVQTPYIDDEYISEVIKPHIVIKAKEEQSHEQSNPAPEKRRGNTFILEETRLS